jgi:hypothetical protein
MCNFLEGDERNCKKKMNFSTTWAYKTSLEALATSAKLIWPDEKVNVSLSQGKYFLKTYMPFKMSYKYLIATGWCSKTIFHPFQNY